MGQLARLISLWSTLMVHLPLAEMVIINVKSADITGGVTASLYIARFVPETTEQIHSGGIRDDLLAVSLVWSSCVLDITADVYADSGSFTANSLQGT